MNLPAIFSALARATLFCCLAHPTHAAMRISPIGEGEVLLVPYYSAIEGDVTLITINNPTDYVKAVGISVREGLAGREGLGWATYIAPGSAFTFGIKRDGSGAAIKPTTDTCTVPRFDATYWQPMSSVLWDGSYDSYYGAADSFSGEEREQAGSVEVIEMGQWHPSESVKGRAALERDCESLVQAWSFYDGTDGDWRVDPTDEALPWRGGGLSGTVVIESGGGTVSYQAIAIDGFARNRTRAEYHGYNSTTRTSSTWTPGLARGSLSFQQTIDGTVITQTAASGLEALSAVLDSTLITAQLPTIASSSAPQSWIVTMPTKHLHTDNESLLGPFSEPWNSDRSESCDVTQVGENTTLGGFKNAGSVTLCASTNVLITSNKRSPAFASPSWLTQTFAGSLTEPINALRMASKREGSAARDRRITVSTNYSQDTDIVGLPVIAIPLYADRYGDIESGSFGSTTTRLLKRLSVSESVTTYGESKATVQLAEVNESGVRVDAYSISCSAPSASDLTASSVFQSVSIGPLEPGISYTCSAVAHTAIGESEPSANFYIRLETVNTERALAFIERFYQNILGRASDTAGLNNWFNVIQTQSATTVAIGFLQSREFLSKNLNDAEFVDTLYRTLFDRAGDPAGTEAWLAQLASGRLREMVMYGFLRSSEFLALADSFGVRAINANDEANYGKRAFVERFYTLVLGRQPDQIGFEHWVGTLTSGSTSGGDIARAFFLSSEYQRQNTSDVTFVETCYQAFFGRTADDQGMLGWLGKLAEGQARSEVLSGFANSDEFVALARSYGIRP